MAPEYLNSLFENKKKSWCLKEDIQVIQEVDESKSKNSPTSSKSQKIMIQNSKVDLYSKPIDSIKSKQGLMFEKELKKEPDEEFDNYNKNVLPSCSRQKNDKSSEVQKNSKKSTSISRIKSEQVIRYKEKNIGSEQTGPTLFRNIQTKNKTNGLHLPIKQNSLTHKDSEQPESNRISTWISKPFGQMSPIEKIYKTIIYKKKLDKEVFANSKSADIINNSQVIKKKKDVSRMKVLHRRNKSMLTNLRISKPKLNTDSLFEYPKKFEVLRSSLFSKRHSPQKASKKFEGKIKSIKTEIPFSFPKHLNSEK